MQKYLVNTVGMHAKTASDVITAALFVYMLMQLLFGALSDKIGRRQSMIFFGLFAIICTVPLLHELKDVTNPSAAFGLVVLALAIVGFYTSISGLIKAGMFSAASACPRRGTVVCARQCNLWGFCRVCGAVAQVGG